MNCYKCGGLLSEHDFCTNCGADVALYKRIMRLSNHFYNDGLEKATVRDLSGAVVSLRQSLKYNKNHIEARNLLGLVYFEMGEVVAALREWVTSQNIRSKKNIANDYVNMVQSNPTRLDTINQTIKKYNQALLYCYQDSLDLAVIQLKKVLSYNPKFLQAHQLLALLYINSEEWEKAQKELFKCSQIDANNTTTLRYQREVERMLLPENTEKGAPRKEGISGKSVRYQSGNEMIIQPMNTKESKGVSSLVNLGLGVIIGVAIACFLILPARIQSAQEKINNEMRAVSEQSDAKTATIDELEQRIQKLEEEKAALEEEIAGFEVTDDSADDLMLAVGAYLENPDDLETIIAHLDRLEAANQEEDVVRTEAYTALYDKLVSVVSVELEDYYYDAGYASFVARDYEAAIPNLQKAYQSNDRNVNALFYMGLSCYRSGHYSEAKEAFAEVIDKFPTTNSASQSRTYLAEINNMGQ
ncbi:MAG: tetratricopeptide repeat protein [Clostridium sp.]|nr:tetratricopeptide repeat protein [Clostridium sp.]